MNEINQMTLAEAFSIQLNQLRRWKGKLKISIYAKVAQEALVRNFGVIADGGDPYKVWRGGQIDEYIHNLNV